MRYVFEKFVLVHKEDMKNVKKFFRIARYCELVGIYFGRIGIHFIDKESSWYKAVNK